MLKNIAIFAAGAATMTIASVVLCALAPNDWLDASYALYKK